MTTDLWCLTVLALWTLPMVYLPAWAKARAHGDAVVGLRWGTGNRDREPELAAWGGRAVRAAANHFENLPMFAALVLVAHASGEHDDVTATASVVYVVARVAHASLYWVGVGVARSVAYYVGNGALLVILSRLF